MPDSNFPPAAITSASVNGAPSRGGWNRQTAANSLNLVGEATKVALNDLALPPNWYRLRVWATKDDTILSARVRFLGDRRADFRIRMEPVAEKCFQKTFKSAEPISSFIIAIESEQAGSKICRIEIVPLGTLSIVRFLMMKGVQYARTNRGRINWKTGLMHLRAALNPRGNFVFRTRYDKPSQSSYDKWQALHEHTNSGSQAAKALDNRLGHGKTRVGLLVPDHLSADSLTKNAQSSLIGSSVEFVTVSRDGFKEAADSAVDFILPIDHEGVFPKGAIERLVLELLNDMTLAAVFADSDTISTGGTRQSPRLKPLWDQALLWCGDYIRAPLMIRRAPDLHTALDLPGADRKPAYALALMLLEKRNRSELGRIPAILFHETGTDKPDIETERLILEAHLRALDTGIVLTQLDDGILKVDWAHSARGRRVSIIIPSKDNPGKLKPCIDSIIELTHGIDYEIVVSDNGSLQEKTWKYLDSLSGNPAIRVISSPGPFNFSKINNDARKHATGDVLVFLNDDTKVIAGEWLVELASLACRDTIGAVGALLLYPNGSVQHAGMLIGVGGSTDHAFRYLAGESRGYLNLLRCRREVSAVTGACLAVLAERFDAVGGFDEQLMVTCNDLDLCLRLRAAGLINVWTPWARLEHWESLSRRVDFTAEALERQAAELRIMSERWGDLLDRDPNYHPGLSVSAPDYGLSI